jgi:hypothetical protein
MSFNNICHNCFGAANNDCEKCKRREGNRMNPTKNSEGYADPTAYNGLKDIIKEETEIERLNHKVIQSFRLLVDLAGFEIVGRVTLKHKKSGKVFR